MKWDVSLEIGIPGSSNTFYLIRQEYERWKRNEKKSCLGKCYNFDYRSIIHSWFISSPCPASASWTGLLLLYSYYSPLQNWLQFSSVHVCEVTLNKIDYLNVNSVVILLSEAHSSLIRKTFIWLKYLNTKIINFVITLLFSFACVYFCPVYLCIHIFANVCKIKPVYSICILELKMEPWRV